MTQSENIAIEAKRITWGHNPQTGNNYECYYCYLKKRGKLQCYARLKKLDEVEKPCSHTVSLGYRFHSQQFSSSSLFHALKHY